MKKIWTILLIALAFSRAMANPEKGYYACPSPGSFTLNNPSASNVGATSVSLSWGTSSNATNYTVYYKLSSSSSWTSAGATTSLSKTVTGLTSGQTYNFKVTANRICFICSPSPVVCDELITEESHTDSNSRTETLEPPTPSILTPQSETVSSFTARWSASTGASSYKLDVSTNSSFSSGNVHTDLSVTGTSRNVTGLNAGTRYYYRVRAVNSNGESGESPSQSAYTVPDAPTLNAIASIDQTSFQASWNLVTGAESYRLDVSTSSGFSSFIPGYNSLIVAGTSSNVNGLDPATTYYVRVRAFDSDGSHTSSNSSSKIALTIPATPGIELPSLISQTSFTANWSSVSGADNYVLDVSTDNFLTYETGYEARAIPSTGEEIAGLNPATEYQYRVRSKNATGESPNSSVQTALTIPSAPVSNVPTAITQASFMANWSVVTGADYYVLDVSSDNFSSYLTGYEAKEVTSTSEEIAGLDPATDYQYRVRSKNSSGVSPYGDDQAALTISANPISEMASSITQTSFIANWSAVNGADNYLLDVSIDNFVTFLAGYEAKEVISTNEVLADLDPGTEYKYRLRSKNATGESGYSATITAITLPADPLAFSITEITKSSFKASWQQVDGAESYLLDVSISSNFSNFVSGYEAKEVSGTMEVVVGLESGTEYFCRVRSRNVSGESNNSETKHMLLVSETPTITGFSERSATNVKMSWTKTKGVETYEILVSEDSEFTTLVAGNDPKQVSSSLGEVFIEGLLPSTVYFVKIQSRNATGASGFSDISTTATTDSNGNSNDPEIEVSNADVASINFNVKKGLNDIRRVSLFHKKRSESEFREIPFEITSDGVYFREVQPEWLDEFGLDYKILVEDAIGINVEFSNKVIRQIERVEVSSVLSFGTAIENYSIISVPYDMGTTIEDLFEKLLGRYDDSKWRVVQFRDGGNVDYAEGLSKEELKRGSGYWFISDKEVDLNLGSAFAPDNSNTNLFRMTLKAGWNQIGNPYPFNLSWKDIVDANPEVSGVSSLFVFDPTAKAFDESDKLKVFGGGFVFSNEGVELDIPMTTSSNSGRKISGRNALKYNEGWEVSFEISNSEVMNSLSAVGMSSSASSGIDPQDQVTLPRFADFLELKSVEKGQLGYALSKDFVELQESHTWHYKLESNTTEPIKVSWKLIHVPTEFNLIVHDVSNNQIINMRDLDFFSFQPGTEIKIHALNKDPNVRGVLNLGVPYPNPVISQINIPFDFNTGNTSTSQLIIFDINGKEVIREEFSSNKIGLRSINSSLLRQDGTPMEEGTYLFKVFGDGKIQSTGRIIKK